MSGTAVKGGKEREAFGYGHARSVHPHVCWPQPRAGGPGAHARACTDTRGPRPGPGGPILWYPPPPPRPHRMSRMRRISFSLYGWVLMMSRRSSRSMGMPWGAR